MNASKSLPRVLTDEEQEQLLAGFNTRYWTPQRDYTACLVMLDAGLRVSEVTALQMEHLDLRARRIVVRDGKGSRDRRVPVIARLADALEEWLDRRPETLDSETPWVFPTRTGEQLHPNQLRRTVSRIAERVGLREADRVSPHTLRHSFATDVLNETGNLELVRRLLGHADISTTQLYAHLADRDLAEALDGFRAAEAAA